MKCTADSSFRGPASAKCSPSRINVRSWSSAASYARFSAKGKTVLASHLPAKRQVQKFVFSDIDDYS